MTLGAAHHDVLNAALILASMAMGAVAVAVYEQVRGRSRHAWHALSLGGLALLASAAATGLALLR
ncbi:hypothetical protein GCM10007036_14130 [Alsobacter metallidurans]|uniref:Uncharacterized protein n=1 Tax=Alsobacter metallidurans TaxID=340221 RepID=A0A917MGF8_9HYPH|nr:hypothetical protein [Alsobacter metallidurans]GGH14652.1 hypothetical protein GCM10007036_14130 [Alsobacter metallidurans]